jgi:PAS domain S-box-containing protein
LADTFEQEHGEITSDYRAALFDAAPEPILLLNVHGTILHANLAAQRLLGGPKRNLAGCSAIELIAPDRLETLRAALAAAAAGRACRLEMALRDAGGAGAWLDARFGRLAEKHPGLVVMTCHDITAARRRDLELSGQAGILRAIAEGAKLHDILDSCCELAETLVDGARCSIMLYDAEGAAPPDGAVADPPPVLLAALHDLPVSSAAGRHKAKSARFRLMVARRDMVSALPAEDSGDSTELYAPEGDPSVMSACWSLPLCVGRSVAGAMSIRMRGTEAPPDAVLAQIWRCANLASLALSQLQARNALAESEARFRVAAEVVPGFLFVYDPSGTLTYVNQFYRERTGRSGRDLMVARMDTIHPDDREACVQDWQRAIEAGTGLEGRYRVRMANGGYRWFLERGMPQRDAAGAIIAWVGVAVDIDELIASREAIQRYRTELEELVAERTRTLSETASELHAETSRREQAMEALAHKHKIDALGQLTAGVAHDFNNLLVAIMGGFQLIDAQLQDASVQQLTRNGLQAAERAASLVRQLLAVARREPPRPETVDLAETMPAMRDLLRHALNPRHTLNITVTKEVWLVVVDAPQLETALLNLAVNSRDAMGEHGTLTITAANAPDGSIEGVHGDHVIITVADTGGGIPAHLLQRVSEPFFTTKPRGEGTGLGLAMVKNFALASGGDIAIDSVTGEGTRIHVRLPRARAQSEARPVTGEIRPRETCVLVVEGDDAVRPITSALLRDAGYRVVEAANSAVALALMQIGGDIDVMVTGSQMTSMDGLRLVRAVRAVRPSMPAVVVTSHGDDKQVTSEIVVQKPFAGADLTQAVARALGRSGAPEQGRRSDRLMGMMRSATIRDAYMMWQTLRGEGSLPGYRALQAAGAGWAANAFVVTLEPHTEPPHFRWVSIGEALHRYLPFAAGELVFESAGTETLLGPLEQIYRGCAADRMPHFQAVDVALAQGWSIPGERIVMPATADGEAITHLVGIIAFDSAL